MTTSDSTVNLASTPVDSPASPQPLLPENETLNLSHPDPQLPKSSQLPTYINNPPPLSSTQTINTDPSRSQLNKHPNPSSNDQAASSQEHARRKRKKTRAFEVQPVAPLRRYSTGAQGVKGRGVKFAAIPNIAYMLDKSTPTDLELQFLHRLLFNSLGAAHKRKTNIRNFSGYIFSNETERTRIRDKILRCRLNVLKKSVTILDMDIDFNESREIVANKIIAFLEDPKPIEGRVNLAIREKMVKAERRKRAQKAKALKEAKQKEALKQAKANRSDSEEDGDIDLERDGKTWIQIAEEWKENNAMNIDEDIQDKTKDDINTGD